MTAVAASLTTRYERMLRNYARALSDFAGCTEPGAVFDEDRFREWVQYHRDDAKKCAGAFIAKLLHDKATNRTVGYSARLYISTWRSFGVEVDQAVYDELSRLTRDKWKPATATRLSALGMRKSDQFDLLEAQWVALLEYLGSTTGENFAEHCRVAQVSQPTSIACELAYLSHKSAEELKQTLLRTRAFVSVLRATGMRSVTAVTLRLDQFTSADDDGALLLKRMERKCGSTRNVEKPIYVCVVPHVEPKLCPLVHIAAALGGRADPGFELFAEGFTHKHGQDYVSFATMIQRRYIAVLQCAAVAIGFPELFSEKKLHAFRVQCTNVLGSKGASEAERETHIGWQSTVQSRHYASQRHIALNARTPHLLAGRSARDDPPHPMWQCLAQAPGDNYWGKVLNMAAAAGFISGVDVPDEFRELLYEKIAAGYPEREDSPTYLLKRINQLEQENNELRCKKRTRPDDAALELKDLVNQLKRRSCDPDFPEVCLTALPRLTELVEDASDRGSFGLAQSSSEGKALVRILTLAAVTKKHGAQALPNGARAWLSWVVGGENSLCQGISTKSWTAFKASVA